MRILRMLIVAIVLAAPSAGLASSVTVGPDSLCVYWWYGGADTIRLLPGTYTVGVPSGWWPLPLSSESPTLVGVGGPEGVTLLGTGVERAFYLSESTYDAHMHFERLTFSGLAEIIGRQQVLSGYGELRFTDNIVEDCGLGPVYPPLNATSCWGIIARNTFRNNAGPAIGFEHASTVIEDNDIYGNGDGIVDWCCTSPRIRGNHIHDNLRAGISAGYTRGQPIEYNLVERNGTGLLVGALFTVEHNIIRDNEYGVWSGDMPGTHAEIHHNDIYGNAVYNLGVWRENDQSYDCTMNWWGSVDSLVIAQGIYDCNDDPEVGVCVVFAPFCETPGCEPTQVELTSWGSIKALYLK